MSLFDTNILIDCLKGVEKATKEIKAYRHPCISVITFMEVLAGAPNQELEMSARGLLSRFEIIDIDKEISELAIKIRKTEKIKLLDSIILATAQARDTVLITRNTKDFKEGTPHIRVPYKI